MAANTASATDPGDLAAFILRVSLGVLFLAHAGLKIFVFTLPGTAAYFAAQGFPGWTAYAVVAGELAIGAGLILGILVRVASIASLPILVGALAVHLPNGWVFSAPNGGWEFPALWIVLAVVQALLGAGAYAVKLPYLSSRLAHA
ncbi:MAG: DoxX family protein [Pseudorhodoplanes sp.]|jgi:putative oxidoreductase|nr:DoxX family protein [Pseudorhodoplanes sp.]